MKSQVLIRAEAEAEIEAAYRWYIEQRDGLEEALDKIQRTPEMYPIVHRDIRCLLIRGFPYGIFYTARKDIITILAVFHGHRDPKHWKSSS